MTLETKQTGLRHCVMWVVRERQELERGCASAEGEGNQRQDWRKMVRSSECAEFEELCKQAASP